MSINGTDKTAQLSETLEDYLEIILMLSLQRKVVRVRDIARHKSVKMPTVTAALRRLAEKSLVEYAAREYVELTPVGNDIARRVVGRHRFLTRFLEQLLGVPADVAETDACGLEHHLSEITLGRLAAFVEYIDTCPSVEAEFLSRFKSCFLSPEGWEENCDQAFCPAPALATSNHPREPGADPAAVPVSVTRMIKGQEGEIVRLRLSESKRDAMIRNGMLPGVQIQRLQVDNTDAGVLILLQGQEIKLSASEAAMVFVRLIPKSEGAGS